MQRKIGFWEAFSIGVGGMIGGGIFAVLGLSIQLSKSAAPISFLLAGVITLITAYSYAKLSVRFPSEGGTIEFLIRSYGTGILSGTLNILLLSSYVVMISLYAYAFGSYGVNLLSSNSILTKHAMITLPIIVFTFVNALGAVISGKTEDAMVAFKLSILLLVAAAGMMFVNPDKFTQSSWDPVNVIAGGMVIFLAYEGFELIANTSSDVEDISVLPKAFYTSVLLVVTIYVLIAVVTVGNLSYDVIIKARDYALAIAAEPSLGSTGFLLVSLAALTSTSSAINATLYGTARASYMVAKYGQLPKAVEKPLWRQAYEGLIVISISSLFLANFAPLESISTAGSGGFLIIFLFVNLAAVKLRNKLRINPLIPAAGVVLTFSALLVLIYRMSANPENLLILSSLILLSFILEVTYRLFTGREIEEFLDVRLKKKEENIRNWHVWVDRVVDKIVEVFEDAEIYLVGSIARGEIEKANDVDLLIFTDKPPDKATGKRIAREIIERANLTSEHSLDIHFEEKSRKTRALKKAGIYKTLK